MREYLLVVHHNLQYSGILFAEEHFARDRKHRDRSGIRR